MSMIEYALKQTPRHGDRRSVMSYADLRTMPTLPAMAESGGAFGA